MMLSRGENLPRALVPWHTSSLPEEKQLSLSLHGEPQPGISAQPTIQQLPEASGWSAGTRTGSTRPALLSQQSGCGGDSQGARGCAAAAEARTAAGYWAEKVSFPGARIGCRKSLHASPSPARAKRGCERRAVPATEHARLPRLRLGPCTWELIFLIWERENREVGRGWDWVEVISRTGGWPPPHLPPSKKEKKKERKTHSTALSKYFWLIGWWRCLDAISNV